MSRLKNQRTSGDHPNFSIVKIDENTEKIPRNLRKLTVTHTPSVCEKTLRNNNNNNNDNNNRFWNINGSPNFGQTSKPYNNQQKRENWQDCRLCCPGRPQSKIERIRKEGSEPGPCSGIEKKKLWNTKLTIIQIVIGGLRTVTEGLLKGLVNSEITGRVENVQTSALLRSARILRKVLETCCHSDFSRKIISWCWCENLSKSKI